jgi:nucleotide-binding universal stress UspA family protein
MHKSLIASSEEILREAIKFVEKTHPDIEVVEKLEEGHPASRIVEVAQSEDVDLIVMGSRGMGGIRGFLGSTSRHVVEACKKPILLVK